jgi:hypothetical protein
MGGKDTSIVMAETRLFFTVTAGRSGQASLTNLLNQYVPGCLACFEEPQVNTRLPRILGDFERLFRRRFIETHELLGRGRVLTAFDNGNESALDRFAENRLDWIDGLMERLGKEIFVDVSKYFARGMHRSIARVRPGIGMIRLVRDPILNMRSFMNRNKNFYLDNNRPDGAHNELSLDPDKLSAGELYLWAWSEMYLRFDALVDEFDLAPAVEIRTEDLNDAKAMHRHFLALGLEHETITVNAPANTNMSAGYGRTVVRQDDIELFERFHERLPQKALDRIAYFYDYNPRIKFQVTES